MPRQRFSHTATTEAPPAQVWEALDRPSTWEEIGGVERVFDPVVDERGRLRSFAFETTAGGRTYPGKATPRARDEGSLMAWDIATSEVSGSTTVEVAGNGTGGSSIRVTVEIASRGLLSTMLFPVIATAIGSGLPGAVESFAARVGR